MEPWPVFKESRLTTWLVDPLEWPHKRIVFNRFKVTPPSGPFFGKYWSPRVKARLNPVFPMGPPSPEGFREAQGELINILATVPQGKFPKRFPS